MAMRRSFNETKVEDIGVGKEIFDFQSRLLERRRISAF
jgi:hypothetical protein